MREGWQYVFFFLFTAQYAVLTALIAWHEVHTADGRPWQDTLIAIGQGIAPWSIPIAIDSVLATEVVVFLAEKYIIRRYERGREEGWAESEARWEAWNRRREVAAAAGEEFTEPPPSRNQPEEETINAS